MAEKKKISQRINERTIAFFIGVTICLFSVILIMNVGAPARLFALPFLYLFGVVSYVFYILLYALGLSFLFRGKGIKLKLNSRFFGGLLIFVGLLVLATLIQCKNNLPDGNFVSTYNNLMFNTPLEGDPTTGAKYWKAGFINLFQRNPFGGGLLGYMIIGILPAKLKVGLGWTIVILLLVFGLFLILLKNIVSLIKKNKKPKENKERNEIQTSFSSNSYRSNEREIIKGASQLDKSYPNDLRTPNNNPSPVEYNRNANPSPISYPAGSFAGDSSFVPARFIRHVPGHMEQAPINPQPQIIKEEPMVMTGEQAILEENKISTRNEQLTLDFNAHPQYNEELLTAKPEFAPIENKPAPAPVAPNNITQNIPQQVNNQPVVNNIPKPRVKWIPPSTALLEDLQTSEAADRNNSVAEERKAMINQTFESYGVRATCVDYIVGPSVTNFRIQYDVNVKTKDVFNLVDDICRNLGGIPARFQKTVEGTQYSGIEVSNAVITPVAFKEVFEALPDAKKKPLAVAFGKNIDGSICVADIADFPHALVSGTTGSGKSVFIQSVICTLIMRNSPDDLKLVLVDPKQVEMASYRDIPHLLCPVISDMKKAKMMIDKLVQEMNERYSIFEENLCRSITEYNELAEEEGKNKMPYIVMFIDEYADLVQTYKEVATPVVQIAQKARACGIHMFIATQRPSTDVISGVIKGNLPTRVALKVANATDSITIINEGGAEKLLGKGDMLVMSPILGAEPRRAQSCFIQNKEIRHIIGYLKEHYPVNYDPKFLNLEEEAKEAGKEFVDGPSFNYSSEDDEEAKYNSIKEWVMSYKYMSMSRIQRECNVGFNRAGRFFKRLQEEGIVATETEGNKGCPVLVNEDSDDDNVVTSGELTN